MPKFRAAVIGDPIKHSLSPMIFSRLAEQEKVDLEYTAIHVLPEDLVSFLSSIKAAGDFVGCNVTLPHKVEALKHVDEVNEEVRACGALNVICRREQRLKGFNTDVLGIKQCLDQAHAKAGNAVIYGAGGAARAAAYVLGSSHYKAVFVVNRGEERARNLVFDFSRRFPKTKFSFVREVTEPVSLLINATSLGLSPNDMTLAFPENLTKDAIAFDFVYGPKPTPFLTLADQRGLRLINGKQLLFAQAIETWKLFFGPLKGSACLDF